MSKYKPEDLYDFCETTTTIRCSNCVEDDCSHADDYAPEEFFDKGWRATKSGNVYCPECAKKKLKI